MAKSSIDKIKNLSAFDIKDMPRQEKIKLIASSSKTLYDRYKRLKDSGLDSPYLNKMVDRPKRLLKSQLNKMTDTNLNKTLENLTLKSRNKTSSIKGTKEFYKDFKKSTGVEYNSISSDTWDKIRRKMEENYHSSEEIIQAYSEVGEDEDLIDDYLDSLDTIDAINEDLDEIEDMEDVETLDDYIY